ncbi:unnamed protein product [Adineta steineri]|uniref:Ketosynthase family 3 (KS3) domain-containing protein n=1 Tax=Adineta steineri TaxID=433720 RepID=A0A814EF71_9BILA|nr:unnamed protein product [Adineta steineri]
MAVQCLRTNEGDMAVCGGVNGIFTPESFLQHSFIGAQSSGGRSRSFSVDANSYAKDDGLVLLLLKQLSDAERDGDPIEANCLDRFFNRSNLDPPLLLGSIKSNLGHTEGTAGVASLIKPAMCMYYRGITANMQFTSLNPKTEAQKYNLYILQNFLSFPTLPNNEKIAIGVNSFGMDGTTTHTIIEEYQLTQKICFVFSGQGPPWWSMDRQSYESEPLFNKWIHLTDAEMTKSNNGEWRLLEELIEKKNERESRINDTNIAQPPLFAIQVALTVSLISWNIYPSSIISHSAGDQAAAFVAGLLSLKEAVRMLVVSMSEEEVENRLLKDIEYLACIAVVNSPRSVTISGDEIQQILSITYPNVFKAYIRRFPIQDQKQIFDPICAKAKPYSSVIGEQMNDNIPVDDESANVFLETSPHPVLATSIRECYELTNQQQSSPIILLTLKRKENEQTILLTSLAQLTTSSHVWKQYFHIRQILPSCWYESKDSSIQRSANRISTHPLFGIRQLNDQTNHKIQDAILFPAVAYLELATAACHQLLSSKKDDQEQQPTLIFEDVNFIKALILNEHKLIEVFTQIIMPMREWYIIFCSQDNLNKYSLNEFTLHAQGKIEIDFKQQKSLTIPDRWTIQDIRSAYAHLSTRAYRYGSSFQKKIKALHVLLPGVETTFLPVPILKFIYLSKTKAKMNRSINVEVRGKIWTDSPTIKDISHLLPSPNQILNNELNSISNQDLTESIEPFNELATYYAQMAIKDLDLNQQQHPLLNACRSLASTLHSEQVTWHSTHLRLIQLIERFPRLEPFLMILNKHGLHLKDILNGEENGLDIFFGDDDEIERNFQQIKTLISAIKTQHIFHSICQHLQLQYERQTKDNNSFENYRLCIFWLTNSHCSDVLPILDLVLNLSQQTRLLIDLHYADSDPIQLVNAQQTFDTHITNQTKNLSIIYDETIDLYDNKTFEKILIESFHIIFSSNQLQHIICSSIPVLLTNYKQACIIFAWQLDQTSLNENNDDLAFQQNEELICGTLSLQYLTWHYEMLQNNDDDKEEKSKYEQISIIPKQDVDQKPFRICVPPSRFLSPLTWIEENREKELSPSDMVD